MQQTIGSGDVNEYLREITGEDFTAKDFRTWTGTILALEALQDIGPAASALGLSAEERSVVRLLRGQPGGRRSASKA